MPKLIAFIGNLSAVAGLAICLISGISRLMGNWETLGYSTVTLFIVGIGLMVVACLAKLHLLSRKTDP